MGANLGRAATGSTVAGGLAIAATTIIEVSDRQLDPSPQPPSSADSGGGARSARTDVYTDGACSGNPGPGGWAWATVDGRQDSGGDPDTTNQRMELTAVLQALQAVDGPVTVYSDSTYVVNCFNDRWYEGWLARNWRNANRKSVANRDLWEPLVDIFGQRRDELAFVWVKGHSGDRMNDLVDALAVAEVDKLRPDRPGGDDSTAPGTAVVAPWPMERAIAVTGPKELAAEVGRELATAIAALDPGYDIVVSGLRRGAELRAAELALEHRIPLGVVLPFPDPADRWPVADRRRFQSCVDRAEWTVTLDGNPSKPGAAVAGRNQWLWSSVVGVMVIDDPALSAELDESGLTVVPIDGPE